MESGQLVAKRENKNAGRESYYVEFNIDGENFILLLQNPIFDGNLSNNFIDYLNSVVALGKLDRYGHVSYRLYVNALQPRDGYAAGDFLLESTKERQDCPSIIAHINEDRAIQTILDMPEKTSLSLYRFELQVTAVGECKKLANGRAVRSIFIPCGEESVKMRVIRMNTYYDKDIKSFYWRDCRKTGSMELNCVLKKSGKIDGENDLREKLERLLIK